MTATSRPSGISTSRPAGCGASPPRRAARRVRPVRWRGAGAAGGRASTRPVGEARIQGQRRGRAARHDVAAVAPAAGSEVHHEVGAPDGVGVVLDDEERVAPVPEGLQRVEQPSVVARVQPDRGFVEHVAHAAQVAAQLRREADALRLAAGQGGGVAVEGQVAEAQPLQEGRPFADLAEDGRADDRVAPRERQRLQRRAGSGPPEAAGGRGGCARRRGRRAPRVAAARRGRRGRPCATAYRPNQSTATSGAPSSQRSKRAAAPSKERLPCSSTCCCFAVRFAPARARLHAERARGLAHEGGVQPVVGQQRLDRAPP